MVSVGKETHDNAKTSILQILKPTHYLTFLFKFHAYIHVQKSYSTHTLIFNFTHTGLMLNYEGLSILLQPRHAQML